MSIDKSLVSRSLLVRHRNVLTRSERMKILTKDGLWQEESSVFGLPKVKTIKIRKKTKEAKEKTEEEAAPADADKKDKKA